MASTAFSDIPLIDPSQNGKAATADTAFAAIDSMLNGQLSINAATNASPYTIPYQAGDEPAVSKPALRFVYCKVTGALSSDWIAYLPAGKQRLFVAENQTTGGHNTVFMVQGQTGVAVPPGQAFLLLLNGVDVVVPPLALTPGINPWEIGNFVTGSPAAGQTIMRFIVARTITFPSNFSSNKMKAGTPAAGTAVFNFNVNGSLAGSATFLGGGSVPTWSTTGGSSVVMNAGDVGTFIAPNPQDGALADMEWIFAGTR